ncbi:MAG: cytosine permease [Desulfurococcales archaeon]|nr:cytosine permease [Desulfurococcales archaeon]
MSKGLEKRLGTLEFILLMFSMTTCLPLFFLGPLAYQQGLSLTQAIVAAALGNGIIALTMIANGWLGVKERIDFTEHAKKIFGGLHKIPVFLRGLVGGLWYGVEAFNGALAISLIILYIAGVREGILDKAMLILPILLAIYVASATLVYKKGIVAVGKAASIAGPILLLYFAYLAVSNRSLELASYSVPSGVAWTSVAFLTYLAIQTNWWATVAINISDLTKSAKNIGAVAIGVLVGMLGGQIVGTALGYILAVQAGTALPHEIILNGSPNAAILLIGLLFAFLAPWTTDLAANIPALDGLVRGVFNVKPKTAALIAGGLGFILAPWYAMDKAQDIVNYVAGFASSYGVLLGPILGSMLAYLASKKVTGVPAFTAMILGILSTYLYAYATDSVQYFTVSSVKIPFPPGITIYVGLVVSLLLAILLSKLQQK